MTVNGQEYNLQLVDTAGQDEYSIFPQSYTIDVDGYILIYSVTSYKSFEVVRVIHEKLLDMSTNYFSWKQERLTHGEGDQLRGGESSGRVVERSLPRVLSQRKPDGGGGVQEDDPGGGEDGGGSAAESDTLLYDVASKNSVLHPQHPQHPHHHPLQRLTAQQAGPNSCEVQLLLASMLVLIFTPNSVQKCSDLMLIFILEN
ncbi:GTP-binding protein Rheb isoform X2 [Trachinotus anak]